MGGNDLTQYLVDMLLSRKNEVFNSMIDRKRFEIARKIKEAYARVAEDFDQEVS